MPTVLLTAFEPYDRWVTNASWLTLVELTKNLPQQPIVVTRRYPVDFAAVRQRLREELVANYDVVLHLGQSPGAGHIKLEQFAINVGGSSQQLPDEFQPLVPGGPAAYRSDLPLAAWAAKIRAAGIPAQVSYHAGTFLCNATLYFTHHFAHELGLRSRAAFLHVPLDPAQVLSLREPYASLAAVQCAEAVRLILDGIATRSALAE